jgi:UDP:flavonoid glycosyltransferase YjiC (YdhE family)
VRILCTAVPAAGHINPLLPIGRALKDAGHEVTLASEAAASDTAAAAGFDFVQAGLDEPSMAAQAAQRYRDRAPKRGIAMFATIAAPALLHDLLPQLEQLAPDLVLFEEGEWGGPMLARIAGVPAVAHGWGAPLWSNDELATIKAATAALWTKHGIRPTSPAGLFDSLFMDPCPPLLQTPPQDRIIRRQTIRFEPFDSGETVPRLLDEHRARPLVGTLGTVPTFNTAPELLATIVHALAELEVDALLAIGKNNDPNDLEPLPANVQIECHLSQVRVLARTSVAITHGGAGSTLAALAFGIPLLVLPRGAPSQRRLASRCAERRAALVLARENATKDTIRDAVQALPENDSYRANAERIRDSINAQAVAGTVVPLLEALAIKT